MLKTLVIISPDTARSSSDVVNLKVSLGRHSEALLPVGSCFQPKNLIFIWKDETKNKVIIPS